jgi:predicted Fe-Mo cluster-binding NifX family protein
MKLCIPVAEDQALNSTVYGHFGSAPLFLLVDSETLAVEPLNNRDEHHVHGACNPLKALAGRAVDAVIVGGIGAGAIRGLRQAGIAVYQCLPVTIAEAVVQFKAGTLPELDAQHACGGHAAGGSCHH